MILNRFDIDKTFCNRVHFHFYFLAWSWYRNILLHFIVNYNKFSQKTFRFFLISENFARDIEFHSHYKSANSDSVFYWLKQKLFMVKLNFYSFNHSFISSATGRSAVQILLEEKFVVCIFPSSSFLFSNLITSTD